MPLWSSAGRLISSQGGALIDCATCPCDAYGIGCEAFANGQGVPDEWLIAIPPGEFSTAGDCNCSDYNSSFSATSPASATLFSPQCASSLLPSPRVDCGTWEYVDNGFCPGGSAVYDRKRFMIFVELHNEGVAIPEPPFVRGTDTFFLVVRIQVALMDDNNVFSDIVNTHRYEIELVRPTGGSILVPHVQACHLNAFRACDGSSGSIIAEPVYV